MKDLGKKKLLIISVGIVALVILTVIILLVYNAFFRKNSYEDIENKVLVAAKKYYSDNQELLPKNANEKVTTTNTSLTEAGYLDSMTELTKGLEGAVCQATVTVSYVNGDYRYTTLLDCGENYKTTTLYSKIVENENVVNSGDGLYNLNNELIYRGEEPNNYVEFSEKEWRIVKLVDNKIVLILNQKLANNVWDDRFNTEKNDSHGINNYSVSRVREKLENIYNDEKIFTKENRKLLSSHTLYIGGRKIEDTVNNGSLEKSIKLENQYIGLLPLYDYINASIDKNCKSAQTPSCINYNYLNKFDYNWWTLTKDSSNSYRVYKIFTDGTINLSRANSSSYIRPVIYLAEDVVYASGDGTLENPYKIK